MGGHQTLSTASSVAAIAATLVPYGMLSLSCPVEQTVSADSPNSKSKLVSYSHCDPEFSSGSVSFPIDSGRPSTTSLLNFSTRTLSIHSVSVGKTNYSLKGSITLKIYRHSVSSPYYRCLSDLFDQYFEGKGDTLYAAKVNWTDLFHQNFQELLQRDSKDYSQKQNEAWAVFDELVDIDAYWHQKLFIKRVIGCVLDARSRHTKVRWLDGESDTFSDPKQLPDNFAAYKVGTYFEAIVEETFQGEILQILSCVPLRNWPIKTETLDALEASFPSSRDLPTSPLRTIKTTDNEI